MSVVLKRVNACQLPERLLRQKPGWDVDEFIRRCVDPLTDDLMMSYVIDSDGEAACCFFMNCNMVYECIRIDTFIVDKEKREEDFVRHCMRVALATASAVCQGMGLKRVVWSSPPKLAERMIKLIDDEKLVVDEWCLSYPVDGGQDVGLDR